MALKQEDITRIARLARLELHPGEESRMMNQINDFFEIVEQISAVDTSNIVPLAHPVELLTHIQLRLREDIASEADNRAANQRSAPAVENGLFLVPRVVE
jgi:aspartyl-tRNA(Asn)/glutamyl-tRNA(Gln) amidotransferase subunit C